MVELSQRSWTFGGHAVTVACRRLPEQVEAVTQTLQLDVEELFSELLSWDTDASNDDGNEQQLAQRCGEQLAGQGAGEQHEQRFEHRMQAQARPTSKAVCGNIVDDQPDLIGLDVWPASITLSKYLAAHPALAVGARVMELGAGTGLPGLLCAKLGAAHVTLTDYEQVVVDQLAGNAAINGVEAQCSALVLDWFEPGGLPQEHRQATGLLLLADVIYAAAVVEGLVATIQAVLHPQGVALVAHRLRRPLIFDRKEKVARLKEQDEIFEKFKQECSAAGLHLRELTNGSRYETGKEPLLLALSADAERLQQLPGMDETLV